MANPYVSDARVDDEVRKAVAKALRKDESAVTLDASVVDSLGGTSLDFLDITFRLEQVFGIKLPHTLLVDQIEETYGEGKAVDAQNALTQDAVDLLRLRLGDHAALKAGMYSDEVPALVTPRTLATGVKEVLAGLPAACTHCGAASWKSDDGARVVCGACGKPAAYPEGDVVSRNWIERVAKEKGLFGVAASA
jgi:acyl carrier protein